jgi:hypothetical protein
VSSISDRNRRLLIERIQGDVRLEGANVRAAVALMKVSLSMTVLAGILGAIGAQVLFGEGGFQFGIGMMLGYAAYFGYLALRMPEPRVVGAMAALTDSKVVLLGSRKAGIIREWPLKKLENLEMMRKGNLFVMGKMAFTPKGEEPTVFFTTNRRLAQFFVESYQEARTGKPGSQ